MRAVELPLEREIVVVDDGSTDGSARSSPSTTRRSASSATRGTGARARPCAPGSPTAPATSCSSRTPTSSTTPTTGRSCSAPILKGRAHVVYGEPLHRRAAATCCSLHWVGNRFLSLVTNVLYNTTLSDMETCYKLFDARRDRAASRIAPTASTSSRRSPRRCCARATASTRCPISYSGREFDEGKKITWRDGFAALWTLVKYRFTREY